MKTHKSYGIIDISKFSSNGSQFFGSDLVHKGGVSITISSAEKDRNLNHDTFHSINNLIEINLTNNQFIDAITSGMNSSGIPCTIQRFNNSTVEQINHIEDKKLLFNNSMKDTHKKYDERINNILNMLDGKIGKRKNDEIKHELNILKSHISSNTNFVMDSFNKAMEKTVVEAKHSISNYIDNKIHSLGIESIRKELQISLEKE